MAKACPRSHKELAAYLFLQRLCQLPTAPNCPMAEAWGLQSGSSHGYFEISAVFLVPVELRAQVYKRSQGQCAMWVAFPGNCFYKVHFGNSLIFFLLKFQETCIFCLRFPRAPTLSFTLPWQAPPPLGCHLPPLPPVFPQSPPPKSILVRVRHWSPAIDQTWGCLLFPLPPHREGRGGRERRGLGSLILQKLFLVLASQSTRLRTIPELWPTTRGLQHAQQAQVQSLAGHTFSEKERKICIHIESFIFCSVYFFSSLCDPGIQKTKIIQCMRSRK